MDHISLSQRPLPATPTGSPVSGKKNSKSDSSSANGVLIGAAKKLAAVFSSTIGKKDEPLYVKANKFKPKSYAKIVQKHKESEKTKKMHQELKNYIERANRHKISQEIKKAEEAGIQRPIAPPRPAAMFKEELEPIYIELVPTGVNTQVMAEVQSLVAEKRASLGSDVSGRSSTMFSSTLSSFADFSSNFSSDGYSVVSEDSEDGYDLLNIHPEIENFFEPANSTESLEQVDHRDGLTSSITQVFANSNARSSQELVPDLNSRELHEIDAF